MVLASMTVRFGARRTAARAAAVGVQRPRAGQAGEQDAARRAAKRRRHPGGMADCRRPPVAPAAAAWGSVAERRCQPAAFRLRAIADAHDAQADDRRRSGPRCAPPRAMLPYAGWSGRSSRTVGQPSGRRASMRDRHCRDTARWARRWRRAWSETGHDVMVWNRSRARADGRKRPGRWRRAPHASWRHSRQVVMSTLVRRGGGGGGLSTGADGIAGARCCRRQAVHRDEHGAAGDAGGAGGSEVHAAGRRVSLSVQWVAPPGPARAGKLLGLVGGGGGGAGAGAAGARRVVPPGRACGAGRGGGVDEARDQPAAAGVLPGAGRGACRWCAHLGLEPAWLMELFADTSGGANVLKVRGAGDRERRWAGTEAGRADVRHRLASARICGRCWPRPRARGFGASGCGAHVGRVRRGGRRTGWGEARWGVAAGVLGGEGRGIGEASRSSSGRGSG